MYKEQIKKYIEDHKQEMLEDICTLCRIKSEKMAYKVGMPFGNGTFRALGVALSMAEKYGFITTNYDSYVGTVDFGAMERHLDILAHLDIVPAGEGWTETEAFEPVVKDGKLYGRGTADNKGPAVAALYAMRCVKELGIPLKKNVRLILGTDEECGSSDIAHYYDIEPEAPMTFSPDASYPVVNIEKGRLAGHFTAEWEESEALPRLVSFEAGIKENVVPGKAFATIELGNLTLDDIRPIIDKAETELDMEFQVTAQDSLEDDPIYTITAIGAGAHASSPEAGKNALTALLDLVSRLPLAECAQVEYVKKLVKLFPHGDVHGAALGIDMQDELSGRMTVAFSMLKIEEGSLDGTFDSRCPICSNEENTLEAVRSRMAEDGITLLNKSMTPPHHVDGNSDFVKTLLKVYEDYTGRKGECLAIGGGTYVHNLKNGVAFGAAMPETDNRMHGADEFAVVDELVVSAEIFAQVIIDLCS